SQHIARHLPRSPYFSLPHPPPPSPTLFPYPPLFRSCGRVQDPYSLRCIPQVHGASRNAWLHMKDLTGIELNSVTDNPIVFDKDHTISGGNFHGQPLAMALDYTALAAAELGNISDRRIYLALEGNVE